MEKLPTLLDAFKFNNNTLSFDILHKRGMRYLFEDSVNYLIDKLPKQKLKKDLSKMKWREGKNYNWLSIEQNGVHLLIRSFRKHLTFYVKNIQVRKLEDGRDYKNVRCGSFIIHDKSKTEYSDSFGELNKLIPSLFDFIKERHTYLLWNNYSFVRPEYIEVQNVWDGGDNLTSIDLFVFACEELFQTHLEIFAENETLDKIKALSVGDIIGGIYEVVKINTEVKGGYYHAAGLLLKPINLVDSKEDWFDVYSLTRWRHKELFENNTPIKS